MSLDYFKKIDDVLEELERHHQEAMREGTRLMEKIDEAERLLSERPGDEKLRSEKASAGEQLNELVDYMVLTSGKAEGLIESCKRIEELSKSLLCYSLLHFREKKG